MAGNTGSLAPLWLPHAGLKRDSPWRATSAAPVLPYGSQRKLEVGLSLASAPRVLLLDEPTAGMSPEETKQIQVLIASLPRTITIVIIEHDMDVVFRLADRITVLDAGAILMQG